MLLRANIKLCSYVGQIQESEKFLISLFKLSFNAAFFFFTLRLLDLKKNVAIKWSQLQDT